MTATRGRTPKTARVSVVWTDRALNDLLAIEEYIAADDPVAATKCTQSLADKAMSVVKAVKAPFGGSIVPELNRPEVREVFKGRYRIVYRIRDEGIDILTLFEGHRLFPADVRDEGMPSKKK